jgi:methylase of polypeptide subunit release factors
MDYKGLSITIEDSVYEPAEDSFLAAELIEEQLSATEESALDVIDIGTGTGILGMVAARSNKVASVTFADKKECLCKREVFQCRLPFYCKRSFQQSEGKIRLDNL